MLKAYDGPEGFDGFSNVGGSLSDEERLTRWREVSRELGVEITRAVYQRVEKSDDEANKEGSHPISLERNIDSEKFVTGIWFVENGSVRLEMHLKPNYEFTVTRFENDVEILNSEGTWKLAKKPDGSTLTLDYHGTYEGREDDYPVRIDTTQYDSLYLTISALKMCISELIAKLAGRLNKTILLVLGCTALIGCEQLEQLQEASPAEAASASVFRWRDPLDEGRSTKSIVTVTSNGANLRKGPSSNLPVVGWAGKGDKLRVLSNRNGWSEVAYPTGCTSWISSSLTTPHTSDPGLIQDGSKSSNKVDPDPGLIQGGNTPSNKVDPDPGLIQGDNTSLQSQEEVCRTWAVEGGPLSRAMWPC